MCPFDSVVFESFVGPRRLLVILGSYLDNRLKVDRDLARSSDLARACTRARNSSAKQGDRNQSRLRTVTRTANDEISNPCFLSIATWASLFRI